MENLQKRLVNNWKTKFPAYFGNRNFLTVKKQIAVEKSARLEEPARKDQK